MPFKLPLTIKKHWPYRNKKKKSKSKNSRPGMLSPLFVFFKENRDLNVQIQEFLEKFQVNDERSMKKKKRLEATIASLPTMKPSRDGPPPIPGQRDHFYVLFFYTMSYYLNLSFVDDPSDSRNRLDGYQTDRAVYYRTGHTRHRGTIGNLVYWRGVLHYFDDGPDHSHAMKPVLSKLQRAHLKKMEAKRAAERAGV